MTVKEEGFDETSIALIRNFNMAKGILQRRNTCDNFVSGHHANTTSTMRRSFRLLGSKQNDISRESGNISRESGNNTQFTAVKASKTTSQIIHSPEIGRRNLSVARVAEVFHELQQKLVQARPKHNINSSNNNNNSNSNNNTDENNVEDTRRSLFSNKLRYQNNQVSSRINMFNKVSRPNKDTSRPSKDTSRPNKAIDEIDCKTTTVRRDSNNNTNNRINRNLLKNRNTPDKRCRDTKENHQRVLMINNGVPTATKPTEISEEELIIIKKRKAIGRSNSAMIPLRELIMTRETAKSRRSLSFSLIPEDDTLSLTEAVERRLNLSKETNLCDTDL